METRVGLVRVFLFAIDMSCYPGGDEAASCVWFDIPLYTKYIYIYKLLQVYYIHLLTFV